MTQKTETYDHNSIEVLSELQHIRQNSGMYIGDTTTPDHLLFEVFDNALDEANAGHASLIGVFIDNKTHEVTISDNGRGIPITGDVVKTIATKLFSGGKFKKGAEGSAYGIAAGLHGIGLVAVCALSDYMTVIVYRDNKKVTYKFVDGLYKEEQVEDFPSDKRPYSTSVIFKPSLKYFQTLNFTISRIRERMQLASVHIEHLKLILIVDGNKEIIKLSMSDFFNKTLLDPKYERSPIFQTSNKVKDEELGVMFAWEFKGSPVPKMSGCVNLLTVDQGTHINLVQSIMIDIFNEYAKQEKIKIQPRDCLVGFRCHVNTSMYTPEYTSQTKEKLSSRKEKFEHLIPGLSEKIKKLLDGNEDVKMQLLHFFELYRKGLSAKSVITKGTTKVTRFCQDIDSKLKDCTCHSLDNSELIITEGKSAAGGLVQCRDPRFHAILGLRGKILNLATAKKDFLKNKEIVEIVRALGTGIEPDFSMETARYNRVLFAADADADGGHICALLMILFLKLMPGWLQPQNRVYRVVMPLYGAVKAGKFYPFYDDESLETFTKANPNIKIHRYKGLGEMNPDQLKTCILDKSTRRLEVIEFPENKEEIYQIMADAEIKRGLLNED